MHSPFKAKYRELEQLLMIDQLKANPKKIPHSSRHNMIRMLSERFEAVEIDVVTHFKSLWVTNASDGSEDYLVSERIMMLLGEKIESVSQTAKQSRERKEFKRSSEADYTT